MTGRTRSSRAVAGARKPRRPVCVPAADRPLRLLAGHTRAMSHAEEEQLISALAELLTGWLAAHPDRLPDGLRPGAQCGLVDQTTTKEQPSLHRGLYGHRAGACGDLHPHLNRRGAPAQLPGSPSASGWTLSSQASHSGKTACTRGSVHRDLDRPARTNQNAKRPPSSAGSTCCSSTASTGSPAQSAGLAQIIDELEPTFRVPTVRVDYGYMELAGLEPRPLQIPAPVTSF
jgi:hypothetical protein